MVYLKMASHCAKMCINVTAWCFLFKYNINHAVREFTWMIFRIKILHRNVKKESPYFYLVSGMLKSFLARDNSFGRSKAVCGRFASQNVEQNGS